MQTIHILTQKKNGSLRLYMSKLGVNKQLCKNVSSYLKTNREQKIIINKEQISKKNQTIPSRKSPEKQNLDKNNTGT